MKKAIVDNKTNEVIGELVQGTFGFMDVILHGERHGETMNFDYYCALYAWDYRLEDIVSPTKELTLSSPLNDIDSLRDQLKTKLLKFFDGVKDPRVPNGLYFGTAIPGFPLNLMESYFSVGPVCDIIFSFSKSVLDVHFSLRFRTDAEQLEFETRLRDLGTALVASYSVHTPDPSDKFLVMADFRMVCV